MIASKVTENLNVSLGACTSFEKTASGIKLKTKDESILVSVYNSGVIRIRILTNSAQQDFSYAVIKQPEKTKFEVSDDNKNIYLTTAALKLQIQKKPVRFSFFTPKDELINADDKAFGTSRIGHEITTYKQLQKDERFIGLGEKTGNLDRRGSAYVNWNTDKFGYAADADPIYMTIPFYIGVHNQLSYGIFFDNTFKTRFNFGASNNRFASFSADDGEMNYYFMHGNVAEIIGHYTWLTGRIEMPPMWSLGLQQCRYSYYPDKEVLTLARTFREKQIPADVIYLDIHYMDAYKVFTFDPVRFPESEKMVKQLKKDGFHTVVILDPGIKVEEGYEPYDEGVAQKHFAQYPDGENYSGEVWPGWSHFPDFTQAKTRNWWAEKLSFYTKIGIDGFWNDMNEPASWGQCTPDLVEFNYDGQTSTHKKAHNVYGMQMARSTQQGAKQHLKNQRSFVLNRAGYSGVQRFTATWTGDNLATDEHMLCGVRLVNSLGLSGVPFSGVDVGGFAGDASSALFARWIVLGAFSPLFRCHSMINSKDAEPWAYGEEVEEVSRNYIGLRYRLLPYIYSTFHQSATSGLPVARSLAIEHTHDSKVYSQVFQNQYYFGHAFLVPPVESTQRFVKVYLPQDVWYDLHTGQEVSSGEIIAEVRNERFPIYVKGSSIVPMQSLTQSTAEKPKDVLEVHLYRGMYSSSFTYYEDDGVSNEHENGTYFQRIIQYLPVKNELIFSKATGKFSSKFKKIKLYTHGFGHAGAMHVNGKKVTVQNEDYEFIKPVSSFDPFYTPASDDMINKNVPSILFQNIPDEIQINWS